MNIFKPSGAKILKEVNQIKLNQTFILKPGCWSKFLFIFNFVQAESSWYQAENEIDDKPNKCYFLKLKSQKLRRPAWPLVQDNQGRTDKNRKMGIGQAEDPF